MSRKWTIEEIKTEAAKVDWSRLESMTDEEIRAAWAWDEDAIWPTDAELAEFRLVERGTPSATPPKEAAK